MAGQSKNDAILTEHPGLQTVKSGEVIVGSSAIVQLPDVPCSLVVLTAPAANTGTLYLGASTVTAPDGTADATTGLALAAGASTPLLPLDNVNRLYAIASAAGQRLTYLVLA